MGGGGDRSGVSGGNMHLRCRLTPNHPGRRLGGTDESEGGKLTSCRMKVTMRAVQDEVLLVCLLQGPDWGWRWLGGAEGGQGGCVLG